MLKKVPSYASLYACDGFTKERNVRKDRRKLWKSHQFKIWSHLDGLGAVPPRTDSCGNDFTKAFNISVPLLESHAAKMCV